MHVRSAWSFVLSLLALATGAACSETVAPTADGGSTATLPEYCLKATGPHGLDKVANLQVFDLLHTKVLASAEEVPVSASSLGAGKTLDVGIRLTNTANNTSARELIIQSAQLKDTTAGATGPGAFACFVELADGKQLPCEGHKFAALVPDSFDPACVSDKAAGSATAVKFVVRFTKPADNDGRTATLSLLTTGDEKFKDGATFDVKLRTIAGLPKASVTPATLDFATVEVGSPSKLTTKLINIGDAELEVTAIEVALKDAKSFDLSIDDQIYKGGQKHTFAKPIVLAKNKTALLEVTFNAIDGNGHISELVIHSNDAAKTAKVKLIANQNVPCLKVVPDKAMHFGYVALGTKAPKKLCLSNCGTAPVEVSDLKIGDTSGVFALDPAMLATKLGGKPLSKDNPLILDVNEEVCLELTCEPDSENKDASGAPQPFKGTLVLDDNTIIAAKSVKLECYGTATSCPTGVIDTPQGEQIVPQSKLTLDSNKSFAAAGTQKQVAKRKWSVVKKPAGAEGQTFHPNDTAAVVQYGALTKTKAGTMEVQVNVAGEYVFALKVTDDAGVENCSVAQTTVLVIPEEAIHVELLWDTPGDPNKTDTGSKAGADLDLHFTHPNASLAKLCNPKNPEMCGNKECACQPDLDLDGKSDPFFHGQFDCFWYNSSPNWGTAAGDDNPGLDLDDTDGWGPENLNLLTPENQTYTVGVHSWDEHGMGESAATVNIYILGALKGTYTRTLQECEMWWVKQIQWPSGALLDVPGATDAKGKITPKYKHGLVSVLGGVCK